MDINWSILGWIAGLIFLYIFGIFEGRSQGYKKRKAEEEQERKAESAPAQPATVKADDPGFLRIKIENGSPVVDLDGVRVNESSILPGQRERLLGLLNTLRPWLEGKPATVQPGASFPPPPPPTPTPAKPMTAYPAPISTTPKPSIMAKEDRPVTAAGSIVGQIDSVLQMRLAGTPLEERGVFLAQSPEGGVMVFVGLTKYPGIDDVPDSDIKTAIRAAITEWENTYTPGL